MEIHEFTSLFTYFSWWIYLRIHSTLHWPSRALKSATARSLVLTSPTRSHLVTLHPVHRVRSGPSRSDAKVAKVLHYWVHQNLNFISTHNDKIETHIDKLNSDRGLDLRPEWRRKWKEGGGHWCQIVGPGDFDRSPYSTGELKRYNPFTSVPI